MTNTKVVLRITQFAKIIFGIQVAGFILPFIIEAITDLKAVLFFSSIFYYYYMFFLFTWLSIFLVTIVLKVIYKTERNALNTALTLSLIGSIGPLILVFMVVSNLH